MTRREINSAFATPSAFEDIIKLNGIYSFALLYSLELISFPKCVPEAQQQHNTTNS